MVDVTFVPRITGDVARVATYFDDTLETGGNITIDQDGYTSGLDRVYPVKGRKNIHIETENTGATNGLTYRIEGTSKEFRLLSDLVDADFNNLIKVDTDVFAGVKAFGSVTCATVLATQTVTFNGLLYTGVTGAKANNTEFSVDTGDNETATDLADSISQDTRVGTIDDLTAVAITNVVTAASTVIGTGGNAITLVSSNGTTLAVSGATFSGGVDDTIQDDVIDVSPDSTAIRVRVKRQTFGLNTTRQGIVSTN